MKSNCGAALNRVATWLRDVLARAIILFAGLVPVSCHYEVTGPMLWNHGSSYAFEAWLVLWLIGIATACGAIWLCWQE